MSVGTAFFPREQELNVKLAWGEWAGWFAAPVYADFHDIEYNAIREAVGVIDITPLYKYEISGPDAGALIDRVITRNASKLQVGQVYYSPWCDERGKVVDDGTFTRLSENRYRVTAADPAYRLFHMSGSGLNYEIEDVTDSLAGLALQGPKSRELLEAVTGEDWSDVKYFRARSATIAGVGVDVTRTGYTGDLGYELWIPADRGLEVWDAIFTEGQNHAIRPVGIRALDVSRVEAGLILIEVDYTSSRHALSPEQEFSPFEIGLGRLVDFGKGDFVGKRALQAEVAAGGAPRRLVGLEIEWAGIEKLFAKHGLGPSVSPMVVREPTALYAGDKQVGKATSTTWSPNLKKMIALGSVQKDSAKIGTRLGIEWVVEGETGRINATVVPTPFFDPPRKRS